MALFLLLHLPLLPLLLLPLLLLFFFYDVVVSVALWRLLRGVVSFFFFYRVLPSFTEFFFPWLGSPAPTFRVRFDRLDPQLDIVLFNFSSFHFESFQRAQRNSVKMKKKPGNSQKCNFFFLAKVGAFERNPPRPVGRRPSPFIIFFLRKFSPKKKFAPRLFEAVRFFFCFIFYFFPPFLMLLLLLLLLLSRTEEMKSKI